MAAFSHLKIYSFPDNGIPLRGAKPTQKYRAAIVDVDGVEILLPREFEYNVNIYQDVAQFGDLIPRGLIPVNPRTEIDLSWSVYGPSAGDTIVQVDVEKEPGE